jgi:ribosomal protein S18 acetylase RimI-like enzyme
MRAREISAQVTGIRHPVFMELRWMTPVDADAVSAARHLFDHEVRLEWVEHFLAQPDHHLCIAYASGEPSGFVSGVELTHPDKGTEMFLYELAVDDGFRGRGIGKALVAALTDLARERGCYGVWVLTDSDNSAAVRSYKSAWISDSSEQLMLSCSLDHAPQSSSDGTTRT